MDNEQFQKVVLEQFNKVFERFNQIESRDNGLDSTVVEGLSSTVRGLGSKVNGLDSKVDKNTLLLEETQTHVKIIGEGLVSLREQVDRQFEEMHAALDEKTDLLETVIKAHSSDVNKLKEESKNMQGILGSMRSR